jgi:hypothetical protein
MKPMKSILTSGSRQIVVQLLESKRRDCAILSRSDEERSLHRKSRVRPLSMKSMILVMSGLLLAASLALAQDDEILPDKTAARFRAAASLGNTANLPAITPPDATGGFKPLFLAGSGPGIVFAGANKQNAEVMDFGTLQGSDHEFTMRLGRPVYISQPFKRMDLSAGHGPGYFHHSTDYPSGYSPNCYRCTSRRGWRDVLANWSDLLSDHNLSFGSTFQYVASPANGLSISSVLASNTDHWTNIALAFGFTF